MSTRPITIALNRGRVYDECMPILRRAGVAPLAAKSRQLIVPTEREGVNLVVVRGSDVPTYVERGVAQIGVTGKDTLLELAGNGYYEWLDLGICRCNIMVAARQGFSGVPGRLRVATKFVNVARRYFELRGQQVDIIHLNGAMELAPLMGLSDVIVDIVETGNTLRANNLVAYETIAEVSSRLIVNKAAMKMRWDALRSVLESIRKAVANDGDAREH